MKKMDIKKFRELGYLQELNRKFLHPLGLALSVKKDDDGNEELDSIIDYRNDKEGVYFDIENSDEVRKEVFRKRKEFVSDEYEKRFEERIDRLNYCIEPIK